MVTPTSCGFSARRSSYRATGEAPDRHGACRRTEEEAAVILALLALGTVAALAIGAEIRLGVKAID
jgi:hypothetical protein